LATTNLARSAVEVAALPVAGTTFAERAAVLKDVASCYRSSVGAQVVRDYLGIMNQRRPDVPLAEASKVFAAIYAPLQAAFRDVGAAHEAYEIVRLPVAEESQDGRNAIMTWIVGQRCERPLEVYRKLLTQRLPHETLAQTADRFKQLHGVLQTLRAEGKASDAFSALQTALRRSPGIDPATAVRRFSEALVLGGDATRAVQAIWSAPAAQTVDVAAGHVTVGGIRVMRNLAHGNLSGLTE
jgi:hypothetical protein